MLVSFGYVCYMDASCSVSSLLYRSERCAVLESYVSDKNVGRINSVRHRPCYLMAIVAQIDSYVNLLLGHRDKEHVLKCLVGCLSLVVRLPLLEECRERIAVNHFCRAVLTYCYLSVALYGQLGQMFALAIPAWRHVQLVERDALCSGIAREDVVDA